MTPIDIQVSRSKVNIEGQAYSLYVGEGGHFTNSYIFILFPDLHSSVKFMQMKSSMSFIQSNRCIAIDIILKKDGCGLYDRSIP